MRRTQSEEEISLFAPKFIFSDRPSGRKSKIWHVMLAELP